jgi:hypothetical protein
MSNKIVWLATLVTSQPDRRKLGSSMDAIVPHFVYELVDPRNMSIFYVGITVNLLERYKQHTTCAGKNVQKNQRIQEILDAGHLPVMRTLERVDSFIQARVREDYWICQYLEQGISLLNLFVPGSVDEDKRSTSEKNVGRRSTNGDIRTLILYRLVTGHWPDELSKDMQSYYNVRYIYKDGRYYKKAREWMKQYKEQAFKSASQAS